MALQQAAKLPTLAETFPGFTSTGFLAIAVPKATARPISASCAPWSIRATSNGT